jgi:hypothetical protein
VISARALTDRPVVAATAGALTIAWSAILVRLSHASPSTAAVFRCAYAVPVLALLAVLERRRYGPRSAHDIRLSLVAGAFFAADLIFWHHAIQDVGAGLAPCSETSRWCSWACWPGSSSASVRRRACWRRCRSC